MACACVVEHAGGVEKHKRHKAQKDTKRGGGRKCKGPTGLEGDSAVFAGESE